MRMGVAQFGVEIEARRRREIGVDLRATGAVQGQRVRVAARPVGIPGDRDIGVRRGHAIALHAQDELLGAGNRAAAVVVAAEVRDILADADARQRAIERQRAPAGRLGHEGRLVERRVDRAAGRADQFAHHHVGAGFGEVQRERRGLVPAGDEGFVAELRTATRVEGQRRRERAATAGERDFADQIGGSDRVAVAGQAELRVHRLGQGCAMVAQVTDVDRVVADLHATDRAGGRELDIRGRNDDSGVDLVGTIRLRRTTEAVGGEAQLIRHGSRKMHAHVADEGAHGADRIAGTRIVEHILETTVRSGRNLRRHGLVAGAKPIVELEAEQVARDDRTRDIGDFQRERGGLRQRIAGRVVETHRVDRRFADLDASGWAIEVDLRRDARVHCERCGRIGRRGQAHAVHGRVD